MFWTKLKEKCEKGATHVSVLDHGDSIQRVDDFSSGKRNVRLALQSLDGLALCEVWLPVDPFSLRVVSAARNNATNGDK